MKLTGNTILITGGTSGIGLELANQLLTKNNTVIITGRDLTQLNKIKQQSPNLQIYQSDVSKLIDISSLHDQLAIDFPKLNIIINNAGIMHMISLLLI